MDGPSAGSPAWHAIAMGFAANNVLPLRAGEVVRMGAVSRLGRVPFAAALSSIAVERVMDALVAMGLLSLALTRGGIDPSLTLPGKSKPLAEIATTIGALGLAALIVAALAAWRRETTLGVARKLLPRNRIGDALYHFGERILLGISALSDPRTALPVVGWSLVVWLCNGAAFYAAFAGLRLRHSVQRGADPAGRRDDRNRGATGPGILRRVRGSRSAAPSPRSTRSRSMPASPTA
ncbi:MAG: flippase-like domain-containing protein [Gemmatimonadetes bacterium]|nr:flippase-like domain-containing protein [Gemmatimonadota bacterium]